MTFLTCVFIQKNLLIGDILIMKGISKVFVENRFNRGWIICCFRVNI